MNINEFSRKITDNPPAQVNRFQTILTIPEFLRDEYSVNDIDLLSCYVRNANIGGKNLTTSDIKVGKFLQLAYSEQYESVTLTILLDKDYRIKKFFDDWQASIFNPNLGTIQKFWKEYTTDMKFIHLDDMDNPIDEIYFTGVYPSVVGNIDFSAESQSTLALLTITMSFKKWRRETSL